VDRLQLELAPAGRPKKTAKTSVLTGSASQSIGNDADDVLTPKAAENPVVAALKVRGLYKTPLGSGKHDMTCSLLATIGWRGAATVFQGVGWRTHQATWL